MSTVLLTNGQLRKTLSAARSLGEKGINVIVSETTRFNPSAFSKHCGKSFVYPSPKKSSDKFYNWLLSTIKEYKCDVIFPMDDDVMDIVIENREELSKLINFALPSYESYIIFRDKALSLKKAIAASINCPKTFFPESIKDLELCRSEIVYPVIIKPRKSSGSRGIKLIESYSELVTEYEIIDREFPSPIIQEFIGYGERIDICLLYDKNSELKASFAQKELRHFPIEMGPSTLQESIYMPDLVKDCDNLMRSLNWVGVAEFEFMFDSRDQTYKFMEVNPRFWNSLHAATLAGVDFSYLLYKISMNENVDNVNNYKLGVKCRWLLPGDILHFLANPKRSKMVPPFWWGKRKGIYDDVINKYDIMPTVGFFLACLRYALDLNMWKFYFKR